MSVNFEYYKIFYYVAKYRNISKAAGALRNNQPNLTRVIKLLENELGCQLMLRTNKGIVLTEEGERLYGYVQPAVEGLWKAEEELTGRTGPEGGTVILGASETALHLFLFDRIQEYHEKYPDVRVKIYNHSTPQALAALKNGLIDFAVVTMPVKPEPPVKAKELYTFRDILAGGTRYRDMAKETHSLSDVADCSFVSMEKNTSTYELYSPFFLVTRLEFAPDIEVATADLILPMLENNLGLGFLPEKLAGPSIKSGKICQVRIKEKIPERGVSLVYDTERGLNAAAREMKKILLENIVDNL